MARAMLRCVSRVHIKPHAPVDHRVLGADLWLRYLSFAKSKTGLANSSCYFVHFLVRGRAVRQNRDPGHASGLLLERAGESRHAAKSVYGRKRLLAQ